MKILVVEDEPKVAGALKEGLESEGYEVILAPTGEEGFFQASSQEFDLVILDIMLPGRDGIEVLQTLRRQGARLPVLLLTAKDAIEDRVSGLDAGADDYLGAGLGLSIAQWAVTAHRGSIGVHSEYGSGSIIRIRLAKQPAAIPASSRSTIS